MTATRHLRLGVVLAGVVWCIVINSIVCNDTDIDNEEGVRRFMEAKNEIKAVGPVIDCNEDKYIRWVLSPDVKRVYRAVVLFNAPAHVCKQCKQAENMFAQAAREYQRSGAMNLGTDEGDKLPLLYFMIDALTVNRIAVMHYLTTAPTIAMIDISNLKRQISKHDVPLGHQYTIPRSDMFVAEGLFSSRSTINGFLKWVNEKSGFQVQIQPSFIERMGITGVLVAILVAGSATVWRLSSVIRQRPWIMGFGALGIQWLSTSGLFWSFLQGAMQLYGIDRETMQPIYIMRNRRGQFLGEGLVMGFTSVLFGASLVAISYLAQIKNKREVVSLFVAILIGVAYVCHSMVFKAHFIKSGMAEATYRPPPHFSRGPLMADRMNSL